jgi:hypothetical protein
VEDVDVAKEGSSACGETLNVVHDGGTALVPVRKAVAVLSNKAQGLLQKRFVCELVLQSLFRVHHDRVGHIRNGMGLWPVLDRDVSWTCSLPRRLHSGLVNVSEQTKVQNVSLTINGTLCPGCT